MLLVLIMGEKIPIENIDVFLDDLPLNNKILPGVEIPTRKTLIFKFQDEVTGPVIAAIDILYAYPGSGFNGVTDGLLLPSITRNDYLITDRFISRLISEINSLEINEYQEVISCSLRALFDLCIDLINNSNKGHVLAGSKSLEEKVKKVVEYINTNKHVRAEISTGTGIEYSSLSNLVSKSEDYSNAVKKAHLGAHKSTKHISEQEIRFIAFKGKSVYCNCSRNIYKSQN